MEEIDDRTRVTFDASLEKGIASMTDLKAKVIVTEAIEALAKCNPVAGFNLLAVRQWMEGRLKPRCRYLVRWYIPELDRQTLKISDEWYVYAECEHLIRAQSVHAALLATMQKDSVLEIYDTEKGAAVI